MCFFNPSFWGTITGDPGNFPHGTHSRTCGKDQLGICCHRLRSINSWMEMPCVMPRPLVGRMKVPKVPKVESSESVDWCKWFLFMKKNNHDLDLSHFGGISLFNSLTTLFGVSVGGVVEKRTAPEAWMRIDKQSEDYVWWCCTIPSLITASAVMWNQTGCPRVNNTFTY